MDALPAQNSISHPANGVQNTVPSSGVRNFIVGFLTVLGSGVFAGGIIASVLFLVPYDRVVMYSQPTSFTLRVSSVKLSRGGFVVIYGREESGLALVGDSGYLPAGYYRDIVIPVNVEAVIDTGIREYHVRLYHDTGDGRFSESEDSVVFNRFGQPYAKRFWFLYPGNRFQQWVRIFFENPSRTLVDTIVP